MINKILSLLVLACIMAGCAVQPTKIPYRAANSKQTVNVYSVIEQDELDALYPTYNTPEYIVEIIGSAESLELDAIENTRREIVTEQNLVDIRNELIEFNFDYEFTEEISNKLEHNVHINNISSLSSTQPLENKIEAGETYLLLNTSYKLDMDFRTPFIVTEVVIAQKAKPGRLANDKTLYKNTFTYFGNTLPALNTSKLSVKEIKAIKLKNATFDDDNKLSDEDIYNMTAQSWSKKYKGRLEQQFRKAIQNLLTIISNDIKDTTSPKNYTNTGTIPEGSPHHTKSILIEENAEYKVMRFTTDSRAGAICAMPTKGNEGKLFCL